MLHSYTLKNDKKAKGIRFVLFLFMVVIQATAFAQSGMKITIQKENITVIEALKEVEKQSKLSVGYNDSQLIDKPAINLNLKNIDLEKALSIILIQSPNQKIPDRKTKCVIKTHINIKQNVIFGAKLKPV